MAKAKRSGNNVEIDLTEAQATADRLCRLMGWPKSRRNVMEIWRATGEGQALAVSNEKCNQLAAEIEYLREELKRRDRLIESFQIALKLFVPRSFISRRHYGEEESTRTRCKP